MAKVFIFNFVFAVALIFQIEGRQSMDYKNLNRDFIERVFHEVIKDLKANEQTISQYFSPHYIQYVDGHQLNYNDFVQHMIVQKSLLDSVDVSIEHCVVEGNAICTVHKVDAIKKNGEKIAVKVIAYFEVDNGKIILCDELTYLLTGHEKDQNIGSVK